MRWRNWLQSLHQTQLRLVAQVGIQVRALRRLMTQLGLDRLDGMTAGGGLAGHRMTADLVMAQLP